MNYIPKILFDGENIQYSGRIHWIVYLPGAFFLLKSMFLAIKLPEWANGELFGPLADSIVRKYHFMHYFPEAVTSVLFLVGTYKLIDAFIIANFTELVVTNHRIIAKFGVFDVTTIEMDKNKIAGIKVFQSFWGQIFGYGTVTLRGFAGNITGLPVISNPFEMQKYTTGQRLVW